MNSFLLAISRFNQFHHVSEQKQGESTNFISSIDKIVLSGLLGLIYEFSVVSRPNCVENKIFEKFWLHHICNIKIAYYKSVFWRNKNDNSQS